MAEWHFDEIRLNDVDKFPYIEKTQISHTYLYEAGFKISIVFWCNHARLGFK